MCFTKKLQIQVSTCGFASADFMFILISHIKKSDQITEEFFVGVKGEKALRDHDVHEACHLNFTYAPAEGTKTVGRRKHQFLVER